MIKGEAHHELNGEPLEQEPGFGFSSSNGNKYE